MRYEVGAVDILKCLNAVAIVGHRRCPFQNETFAHSIARPFVVVYQQMGRCAGVESKTPAREGAGACRLSIRGGMMYRVLSQSVASKVSQGDRGVVAPATPQRRANDGSIARPAPGRKVVECAF